MRLSPRRRPPAVLAAALAVLAAPVVLTSPLASYGLRTVTAVAAVVLLWRSPARADPGLVRTRRLVGVVLGLGVGSGLVATGHLLVTGEPSPAGAAADWLYLLHAPVAVLALLGAPRAENRPGTARTLADAAVAACALALLIGSVVLETSRDQVASGVVRAAALGYPLCAAFVLAVLLSVMPLARADLRPFLDRCVLALAVVAVSDLCYALGAVRGWYTPTTWPAVLNQLGLALALLAAAQPWTSAVLVPQSPRTPSRSRSLLLAMSPYVPVLACSLVLLGTTGVDIELGRWHLFVAGVMGLALAVRHLVATDEQLSALDRLRVRERDATASARVDALTGLGNRTTLVEGLAAALERPGPGQVALVLLDLDDFKDVNDTHGHATGDEVLRRVALRLRTAVPPGSLVTRLGGDEFALVVPGCLDPSELGEQVVACLEPPMTLGPRVFRTSASLGVVLCAPGTVGEALAHADVAMYEAKARKVPHRSQCVVLTGAARERAAARVRVRDEVSRPDLAQFRVVHQPVVDLRTGRIIGSEALLRWRHPVLGDIGPAEFVPLAEQVGAIDVLGAFALRTAVHDLARWRAESGHAADVVVGVNLSPSQLTLPGLAGVVSEVLEEAGLPAHLLVLEITEEALVDDWSVAVEQVDALRTMGVRVAVDDFGTGFSSLSYLRHFDTTSIKIDKEFVQGLADEPRTRALVASVVAMAGTLGLGTVAEGVETLDQLHVLRAAGCLCGQGFLFDRPLEAAVYGELLRTGHTYPLGATPRLPVALPAQRPVSGLDARQA